MGRKTENIGFTCLNCGAEVPPIAKGTIRNHCPFCLYSLHVDELPGDRACECRSLMQPVAVEAHSSKGWQIVHKCVVCKHVQRNITAGDDRIGTIVEVIKNSINGIYYND